MGETVNWDRIKLPAVGGFLVLAAAVGVLSFFDHRWPTLAGFGYHAFIAYALFLGALFAAYQLPIKERAFAAFCIMVAAGALVLVAMNLVPQDSMYWVLLLGIGLSLALALGVYGSGLAVWMLISGAIAFWRKPPPRLNGWQRIGIVASVLWALGAWIYTSNTESWADRSFVACLDRAQPGDSPNCVERHKADAPIAYVEQRRRAIVNALIPIALGWPFVYMVIGIARWVRDGFRPARPQ